MVPFLKKRNQNQGVIVTERAPDEADDKNPSDIDDLETAAHDLINAIHSRNAKDVAEAFRHLCEICDTNPSIEDNEEST